MPRPAEPQAHVVFAVPRPSIIRHLARRPTGQTPWTHVGRVRRRCCARSRPVAPGALRGRPRPATAVPFAGNRWMSLRPSRVRVRQAGVTCTPQIIAMCRRLGALSWMISCAARSAARPRSSPPPRTRTRLGPRGAACARHRTPDRTPSLAQKAHGESCSTRAEGQRSFRRRTLEAGVFQLMGRWYDLAQTIAIASFSGLRRPRVQSHHGFQVHSRPSSTWPLQPSERRRDPRRRSRRHPYKP